MNTNNFWEKLIVDWSFIQLQAKDTQFDSVLLTEKIGAQIANVKTIRTQHYRNDDFLNFEEDEFDY